MSNIDQKFCSGIALTPRQLKRLRQRLAEKPLDLDHSHIEEADKRRVKHAERSVTKAIAQLHDEDINHRLAKRVIE